MTPHAAEDTDTDHRRPREEPNDSDDDGQITTNLKTVDFEESYNKI